MPKQCIKKESGPVSRRQANASRGGYTIIETMIAISLFIVIVMVGMNALLNANVIHQKSQSMRSIMDNLSFVTEDISRNLRTGTDYHCIDGTSPNGTDGGTIAHSCTNGGGGISFNSSPPSSQWKYYVGRNPNIPERYSIFKSIAGSVVQLTPDEVNIDSGASSFSVIGAEPPPGDTQQPFVTIRLMGTINAKGITTPFSIQTSVSQRLIDI